MTGVKFLGQGIRTFAALRSRRFLWCEVAEKNLSSRSQRIRLNRGSLGHGATCRANGRVHGKVRAWNVSRMRIAARIEKHAHVGRVSGLLSQVRWRIGSRRRKTTRTRLRQRKARRSDLALLLLSTSTSTKPTQVRWVFDSLVSTRSSWTSLRNSRSGG